MANKSFLYYSCTLRQIHLKQTAAKFNVTLIPDWKSKQKCVLIEANGGVAIKRNIILKSSYKQNNKKIEKKIKHEEKYQDNVEEWNVHWKAKTNKFLYIDVE